MGFVKSYITAASCQAPLPFQGLCPAQWHCWPQMKGFTVYNTEYVLNRQRWGDTRRWMWSQRQSEVQPVNFFQKQRLCRVLRKVGVGVSSVWGQELWWTLPAGFRIFLSSQVTAAVSMQGKQIALCLQSASEQLTTNSAVLKSLYQRPPQHWGKAFL